VLVLVWSYKGSGDREQYLWRYWLPERYIKQWHDKPTGDGWLQEVWAGGAMKQCHCCISYLGQVLWCAVGKQKFWGYYWFTPLTTLSIQTADNCLLPLLFFRCLTILSGCHIFNICFGHQDMKLWWIGPIAYHPHTGFYYSKLLTYLSHDYGRFSNISGMVLNGSEYRQIPVWLCIKNILAMESTHPGCMLASRWLTVSLRSHRGLNIIMGWKVHIEKPELNDT
jgi:hypothetical protein